MVWGQGSGSPLQVHESSWTVLTFGPPGPLPIVVLKKVTRECTAKQVTGPFASSPGLVFTLKWKLDRDI